MRDVQIVVAAEGPDRVLGVEHLTVPMVRSAGEPIDLAWRLDGNKLLTVEATLPNHAGVRCEVRLENPLCSASLGSPRQQEIAELEDAVARAQAQGGNPAAIADRLERLAKLYVEEKKYERAIDRARESMEVDRKPSDVALNLMGISADRLGSIDRAEKYHREAVAVDPGDPTHHFNLSLLLDRQDRALEALHSAEEAFRLHPAEGVYRGWRAILWRKVRHLGEAPPSSAGRPRTSMPWLLAMPGGSTGVAGWRRSSGTGRGRPGRGPRSPRRRGRRTTRRCCRASGASWRGGRREGTLLADGGHGGGERAPSRGPGVRGAGAAHARDRGAARVGRLDGPAGRRPAALRGVRMGER